MGAHRLRNGPDRNGWDEKNEAASARSPSGKDGLSMMDGGRLRRTSRKVWGGAGVVKKGNRGTPYSSTTPVIRNS